MPDRDICSCHVAITLPRQQALNPVRSGSLPSEAPENSRPEEKYFLLDRIVLRE